MRIQAIGRGYVGKLPADAPTKLIATGAKLVRGLDIIGTGESAYLGPPEGSDFIDMAGFRILAGGRFKNLSIDRVRGDFRISKTDAIGLPCDAESVSISNALLTGIAGAHKGYHGDGIQLQRRPDGSVPTIETLSVTNTTIATGYQALLSAAGFDGSGVRRLFLDRVNIRDEPELRTERSFALYLGDRPGDGTMTAPYDIILGPDVWVEEVFAEKAVLFPPGARVSGSIKRGRPPFGDFCPA